MILDTRKTANGGKCILDLGDRYRVETWEDGKIIKAEKFTDELEAWAAFRR